MFHVYPTQCRFMGTREDDLRKLIRPQDGKKNTSDVLTTKTWSILSKMASLSERRLVICLAKGHLKELLGKRKDKNCQISQDPKILLQRIASLP